MSWASRRQGQYLLGLFLFFALVAFVIVYPILTKPATCFDSKKNGTERGVDCGGSCSRMCTADTSEPAILWSRGFHVNGNTYNLLAYIENRNQNSAIENISYEFKIYDTNNLLIGTRSGTTFIPPNQQFAVFEPRFDAGKSEVKSVTFEFTSTFVWIKKAPTLSVLPIKVDRIIRGDDPQSPTLSAMINNESIYDLPAFDVIAILYDVDNNAIQISKTRRDSLASNTREPLLFTWALPFVGIPVTEEIILQINPFTVSF